jgi:hypothetical protein
LFSSAAGNASHWAAKTVIMQSIPSEKYIAQIFQSRYGINLLKIDEQGWKEGATPDFEFMDQGKRVFICELKDFRNIKPSEKDGWKITNHPNGSVEASRISNATNRISYAIEEAHRQLKNWSEPKVLIFLNYSPYLSVEDLEEVYRGYRVLGVENNVTYLDVYARRASEGQIKMKKGEIDLYIWIDTINGKELVVSSDGIQKEDKFYFRPTSEAGRNIVQQHFSRKDPPKDEQ